jgi:hypothetical protein
LPNKPGGKPSSFLLGVVTLEDKRDMPTLLIGLAGGWDDDTLVALSTASVVKNIAGKI